MAMSAIISWGPELTFNADHPFILTLRKNSEILFIGNYQNV